MPLNEGAVRVQNVLPRIEGGEVKIGEPGDHVTFPDGVVLTGVDNATAFNPDADYTITGDWSFANDLAVNATLTANALVGDGSGITNLPVTPFDETSDHTITGSWVFDSEVGFNADLRASHIYGTQLNVDSDLGSAYSCATFRDKDNDTIMSVNNDGHVNLPMLSPDDYFMDSQITTKGYVDNPMSPVQINFREEGPSGNLFSVYNENNYSVFTVRNNTEVWVAGKIKGVDTPVVSSDAANKAYVDEAASGQGNREVRNDSAGDNDQVFTVSRGAYDWFRVLGDGTIFLNTYGNGIKNCPDPTIESDVANKNYVDGAVSRAALGNLESVNAGEVHSAVIDSDDQAGYLKYKGEDRLRWSASMMQIWTPLNMRYNQIQYMGDPEWPEDAANKKYVDAEITALREEIASLRSMLEAK